MSVEKGEKKETLPPLNISNISGTMKKVLGVKETIFSVVKAVLSGS